MQLPTPSFNTWTTIFLVFAFQSVLVSTVLFFHRQGDRPANRSLGLLLLLFAITLFDYELYWTRYDLRFPQFAGISGSLPFLFGPIVLFYFHRITRPRPFRTSHLWHLLPFVVLTVYNFPFLLSSGKDKLAIMLGQVPRDEARMLMNRIIPWVEVAQMSAYAFLALQLVRSEGLMREMQRWAYGLLLCFGGFIIAFAAYFALVRIPAFNAEWDYMISFAMSVFITFVAVFGYVQPAVFNGYALADIPALLRPPARYTNSSLTSGAADELFERLEHLMHGSQLYRHNDLRLESLAEHLGTTKHNLSQVINQRAGLNFFGYVNRFRVEEAKQLLVTTSVEEMHVIEVAYQVGFNTKAAFNTAFKKFTGGTPTEYRKRSVR